MYLNSNGRAFDNVVQVAGMGSKLLRAAIVVNRNNRIELVFVRFKRDGKDALNFIVGIEPGVVMRGYIGISLGR